jgi:hypothetical protein
MNAGCPPLLHPRVKPHILAPIFEMPGLQSPPAAPFFLGKNRRNGREFSAQIAMTEVWRLIFRSRPARGWAPSAAGRMLRCACRDGIGQRGQPIAGRMHPMVAVRPEQAGVEPPLGGI